MKRTLAVVALLLSVAAGAPLAPAGATTEPVRPDALVRRANESRFWGNGVYNRTGDRQSRTTEVQPGGRVSFFVELQNDGAEATDLRVSGTPESDAFAVRYFFGTTRISPAVKSGDFEVGPVPPGGSRTLRVEVEATHRARPGDQRRILVRSVALADTTMVDTVRANVRIPLFTPEQHRIADLVNASRRANGRRPLALNRTLTAKAQGWAEYLARANALIHSNLAAGAPPGWRALGENIGYGRTIIEVHIAYLNSSGHRENIMGRWNQIGTGYAAQPSGRVFTVQVFMRT